MNGGVGMQVHTLINPIVEQFRGGTTCGVTQLIVYSGPAARE
jgi:hypothetical protein